jgi:hypothetical protein
MPQFSLHFVPRNTLFLLAAVAVSMAQTPVSAAPAASPFSKEAFVIERSVTTVSFEADGSETRHAVAAIRMQSDAGVKAFAVLTLPYASANQTLDVGYVRVRKPDGTVINTPAYNIQDMPADVARAAPIYSDLHEKHVAVKVPPAAKPSGSKRRPQTKM